MGLKLIHYNSHILRHLRYQELRSPAEPFTTVTVASHTSKRLVQGAMCHCFEMEIQRKALSGMIHIKNTVYIRFYEEGLSHGFHGRKAFLSMISTHPSGPIGFVSTNIRTASSSGIQVRKFDCHTIPPL